MPGAIGAERVLGMAHDLLRNPRPGVKLKAFEKPVELSFLPAGSSLRT